MKNSIKIQLLEIETKLKKDGVEFDTDYNKIQDITSYYSEDSLAKALETVFEYMKDLLKHSIMFQEGVVFGGDNGEIDAISYISSVMGDENRNILSKTINVPLMLKNSLGIDYYPDAKKEIDRHIEISQIIERVFPTSIMDAAKLLVDNDVVTARKEIYIDKENMRTGDTYKLYKKSSIPFVASAIIAQAISPVFFNRCLAELHRLSLDVKNGVVGDLGKVVDETVDKIIRENRNCTVHEHKCNGLENIFSTILKSSYYSRSTGLFNNYSLLERINSVITPELIFASVNNAVNNAQKHKYISPSSEKNSFGM